jgi:hypothetical protein
VQANNLKVIRGTVGRPGAGFLQINGQPTAQNTRASHEHARAFPAGGPALRARPRRA